MRWVLITFESIATGVLAILIFVVLLYIGLSIISRLAFRQSSNGAVAVDVPGLLGQHWMLIILGTLIGIFLLGATLGFWVFSQRLHR